MKKLPIAMIAVIAAIISTLVFKNVPLSIFILIVAPFQLGIKNMAIVLSAVFLLMMTYLFSDTLFVYPIRYLIRNTSNLHGTVLIAKDGEILYQASSEKSFDYQYLCASLVKQVTAGLIMIENAKGKVILDKPTNDYLPKKHKIDERITVHHLLSHTSGIQRNGRARFPPGSKYEYSNYGYIVLRYVLENVTKENYPTLVKKLFQKLDMNNSYLIDERTYGKMLEKHPNFLPSFSISKGNKKSLADKLTWRTQRDGKKTIFVGNSCGGLVSTVEDLNKWNKNLQEGNIVPQKQYEIMARPVIASNFPAGLAGYGFCMYHGERYSIGYVDGYKATLSYFPRNKITLIMLENAIYHNFNKDFRLHVSIRNTIRYWSRMRIITEKFFTRIKWLLLGKSATPKNNKISCKT